MANYFEQTNNQEEDINQEYNVSQQEVEDMVEILKMWIKKQQHLPKEEDKTFEKRLVCMLRNNKMSIEKTKKKIDMYYAVRNMFPDFFDNRDACSKRMQETMETHTLLPLRKPLDPLTRLICYRLDRQELDRFNTSDMAALGANLLDLRLAYDLCINECYLLDYKDNSLGHIMKVTPMYIKQILFAVQNAYSNRIVGIHFINLPSYAQTIVHVLKSCIKAKIAKRIYVHSDLESLHSAISKKNLPNDYGGEGKSLEETKAEWSKFCENNSEWIKKQSAYKTNEALRLGKSPVSEFSGIEGSFRKLEID